MSRIEKTIFISYRRTNVPWALAIYQNLTMHGYDVFFDYQSIDSGSFEKVILENIKARAHFLVILTPSALERCKEPNDWFRREIEMAMDEKRNIVPLMLESFDFGSPSVKEALNGKLGSLNKFNGLRVYSEYFFEAMDKLRERYLSVTLSDVTLPTLQADAQEITDEQKNAANEAPQVEKQELTAQEWLELGYVFEKNHNFKEAIRCYNEAIRLQPELSNAYIDLGNILKDLKHYEEAEAAYRKAIELNPLDNIAYNNIGVAMGDLKRYKEAEAAYRKAIELNPLDTIAYSKLGLLLYEDLERYQEAEVLYRKVIELNPSDPDGFYNIGNIAKDMGRYEEAEAAYRKAIELNPSHVNTYYNLGNMLTYLQRYAEAEASYRKAIELNPSHVNTYYNLGNMLTYLQRYAEAEASYRKATELNPSYATAYSNLGNLLRYEKRYNEAETNYRKAVELNPFYIIAYKNLVNLLRFEVNDRTEDVLPLLEKLTEISPEDFEAYLAIASISKQLSKGILAGYTEKAREFILADDFYNRACLESVCDNFDLAFEYLQKAAQIEEFNPEWAWEDPDFQWIRDDPRFVEIVGPKPEK